MTSPYHGHIGSAPASESNEPGSILTTAAIFAVKKSTIATATRSVCNIAWTKIVITDRTGKQTHIFSERVIKASED